MYDLRGLFILRTALLTFINIIVYAGFWHVLLPAIRVFKQPDLPAIYTIRMDYTTQPNTF